MLRGLRRFLASAVTKTKPWPPVPSAEALQVARIGGGDFLAVGQQFLPLFKDLASLKGTDSVLEIGCGIGRMAILLAEWVQPPGRYIGFDVVPASISWCVENISSRHPHFRFDLYDIANTAYNPLGEIDASSVRFNYSDGAFDVILAVSVYTHLIPAAARQNLVETRRVIRRGGRSFAPWFMWPGEGATSDAFTLLPVDCGDWRMASHETPEAVVGFSEAFIRDAYQDAGLAILTVRRGNWLHGDHRLPYQDIIVATTNDERISWAAGDARQSDQSEPAESGALVVLDRGAADRSVEERHPEPIRGMN
jgi:SAM-dependent methyltransferase